MIDLTYQDGKYFGISVTHQIVVEMSIRINVLKSYWLLQHRKSNQIV